MKDLKPCPFCGHIGIKLVSLGVFLGTAECGNCGARSPRTSEFDLLAVWNRRAKCGSCAAFKAHRTMRTERERARMKAHMRRTRAQIDAWLKAGGEEEDRR